MPRNPKLSVYTAVNKSLIAWGIKNDHRIRIYYVSELNKRTRPIRYPCIVVDYNREKREWYINYISPNQEIIACTIDDITGQSSIII